MLNQRDLLTVTCRLPAKLRALMKDSGSLFVAGGFIRASVSGEDVSDIDVFTYSAERANEAAQDLAGESRYVETKNAFTVLGKPPIQFIHRWTFPRPEDCLFSFDFTIAQAAVWYEQGAWRSLIRNAQNRTSTRIAQDPSGRRWRYHPTANAAGSILVNPGLFEWCPGTCRLPAAIR